MLGDSVFFYLIFYITIVSDYKNVDEIIAGLERILSFFYILTEFCKIIYTDLLDFNLIYLQINTHQLFSV